MEEARALLVSALGRQSSFWGLGRMTGELYAVLYISPDALTLGELAEHLGVTKGNVSVAIRRLEDLGMVSRRYHTGDRRVFFEANPDFWDIARNFLDRRHRPEFSASFRLIADSVEVARTGTKTGDRNAQFVFERISALKTFYDLLDQLTEALLSISPETLSTLVTLLQEAH